MNENNLTLLHVYRYLFRKMGGPATSVPSLCRGLSQKGCSVSILTLDYDENDVENYGNSKIIKFDEHCNINTLIRSSDIVHIHGVWPLFHNKVMRLCRSEHKKYIVSPRASLMLSDINKTYFKIFKKYIAWNLYLKKNLENASGFHVTAKNEFDDLNCIGFRSTCAIIPNGINVSEFSKSIDIRKPYNLFPQIQGKRILLFLSRIAPKKGLLLLAHAWGKVGRSNPSWHLLIVGPDNENHWPQVKSILDSYDQYNYTRYDYLTGDTRIAVFQQADIFVLPTLWENFGIVVAEALMAGTPVITTTKTPWSELEPMRCGWTVEPTVDSLVNVLNEAMKHDYQTLKKFGERGQAYVRQQFDWRNIAADMLKCYEYILGSSFKPEFVYQLEGTRKPSLPIRKPGLIHELA